MSRTGKFRDIKERSGCWGLRKRDWRWTANRYGAFFGGVVYNKISIIKHEWIKLMGIFEDHDGLLQVR